MNIISIKGKDIYFSGHCKRPEVCAAVSTLSYATINYLTELNNEVDFEENEGEIIFHIKELNNSGISILDVMMAMLKDLASQFPEDLAIGKIEKDF